MRTTIAVLLLLCVHAVRGEEYVLRTYDGKEHEAQLGRLSVPENRSVPTSRSIEIVYVRLASTSPKPGPPIVWLAGGPGTPGIAMARVPVYYSLFEKLREVGDVILLDQRGTGMSSPNLQCPAATVPADVFETPQHWLRAYTQLSQECAAQWRAKGHDLAAYDTHANADDVADLRRALGASKISLIGHSYGTVLAQDIVRRHGDAIERVVFAATDGPDNLLALANVWDIFIEKLARFANQDTAIYRRVFDKLERNPVTLTITDATTKKPIEIRVGRIGLEWLLRTNANDARTFASWPALVQSIDKGDYAELARAMEPLYNSFRGRSPMANASNCSDGWSPARLAQARKAAEGALFANLNLPWESAICEELGATNAVQRPVVSSVPALFISGTLDPNTPPFQAEEVRWGFPNSAHLIVENGGHETLPDAAVQSVIVDFFKGKDVSERRVSFPRPSSR